MATEEAHYQPVDAVGDAVRQGSVLGIAGFAISATQNALARENIGMLGVFTRTGGNILTFAVVGAGFAFTKGAAANLRQKTDSYNDAIAGFVAGALTGLRFRTLPAVIGCGAGASVLFSAFNYTGGKFTGYDQDPNVDEFERKLALRANKRRPIQETIDELGEGRGIYAPGYAERRRERIKQTYGIDVAERKGATSL